MHQGRKDDEMKLNKTQTKLVGSWLYRAQLNKNRPYGEAVPRFLRLKRHGTLCVESHSGRGPEGGQVSGGQRAYSQAMKLEERGVFRLTYQDSASSSWGGWTSRTYGRTYKATDDLCDFVERKWIWIDREIDPYVFQFGDERPAQSPYIEEIYHGSQIKCSTI